MTLSSDLADDGTFAWTLQGAPASCTVELRYQNTMNGRTTIHTVETDASGAAPIPYKDFGQAFAVAARVLTADQQDVVQEFVFDDSTTVTHLSLTSQSVSLPPAAVAADLNVPASDST